LVLLGRLYIPGEPYEAYGVLLVLPYGEAHGVPYGSYERNPMEWTNMKRGGSRAIHLNIIKSKKKIWEVLTSLFCGG